MEFLKETLSSRAFWTGLGPVIVAIFYLAGSPLGDGQVSAIAVILSAIAGWVTVTVKRVIAGKPASYRKSERGEWE